MYLRQLGIEPTNWSLGTQLSTTRDTTDLSQVSCIISRLWPEVFWQNNDTPMIKSLHGTCSDLSSWSNFDRSVIDVRWYSNHCLKFSGNRSSSKLSTGAIKSTSRSRSTFKLSLETSSSPTSKASVSSSEASRYLSPMLNTCHSLMQIKFVVTGKTTSTKYNSRLDLFVNCQQVCLFIARMRC